MISAMRDIYRSLPGRYRRLSRLLTVDEFAELMRELMSMRMRNIEPPKRMNISVNGREIQVGPEVIKLADDLLLLMFKLLRRFGVRPKIIAGCIARASS